MPLVARIWNKFRRSMLGARGSHYPSNTTSRGIRRSKWEQVQKDHELNYWANEFLQQVPKGVSPRQYHCDRTWPINRSMFPTLTDQINGAVVLDVGCGPYGSIDFAGAKTILGIDPLAREYQEVCEITPGLTILVADAERIPLLDNSIDLVISVNALDHFHHPYDALEEMYRVTRPGGHLLMSTDIDGTPHHPVKIQRMHLDEFFASKPFNVIFQEAGTHLPSDWPKELEIPLYVFHGTKR